MLGDGREYEVPRGSHLRGEGVQVPEGTHPQYEEIMCSVERECAVTRGPHLQYEERVSSARRKSVQYQEGHICTIRTGCSV